MRCPWYTTISSAPVNVVTLAFTRSLWLNEDQLPRVGIILNGAEKFGLPHFEETCGFFNGILYLQSGDPACLNGSHVLVFAVAGVTYKMDLF